MLHPIVWLAFFLQGVEGVLGPTGIIGPSGHPVCISYSISWQVLFAFCLLSGNDGAIVCVFSLHQGAQGDRGSQGEMVRGAVFDKSSSVFCELRLGQLVM